LLRVCKGGALLWYMYSALLCIRVLYTGLIVFIGLVYIYIYIYGSCFVYVKVGLFSGMYTGLFCGYVFYTQGS